MNKIQTVFLVCAALCLSAGATAAPLGELNISLGGMFPQGNYAAFTDPGFALNLRGNFRIPGLGFAGGWVDGNVSFFGSDESFVEVVGHPYISHADQSVSETAFSLHGGLQLGVDTKRGFFRPRAALGPGLYIFSTSTELTVPDFEEPLSEDTDSQVKLGWRGVAGVDLFFVTKWGLSFDFTYDHVLGLDHVDEYQEGVGVVRTSRTARYQSYTVGVTIPFWTMGS
jgi:hypothetical protein